MPDKSLRDAAAAAPDPARALNNLQSFFEENPDRSGELYAHLRDITVLFSVSQFLSNYCIVNPDILFDAIGKTDAPPVREDLVTGLQQEIEEASSGRSRGARHDIDLLMNAVRRFRTKELLRITLRDILNKADLLDTFIELSMLADIVIDRSLGVVRRLLSEQYGTPGNDNFSVIALGKLGAEELNFSSDVDLMYVYGEEEGETSGVAMSHGVIRNRISSHEYYCKVGEALSRFLSLKTEKGFLHRVDLRLRPEGQRGALALSLRGYETYYESWGRAWERAMLIRARPVAGDPETSEGFQALIRPFVFRKYLDFSAIDEIRGLKTRIDSTFKKGDIKRGYGGIREIEFFTQTFQLIYGGREPLLRERNTLKALHRLLQKSLIGQEDYGTLTENYRFLRIVEHRLQQVNDIQTHALPEGEEETRILARKIGFPSGEAFMTDIGSRRANVRRIFDSLFAEKKDIALPAGTLPDEEMTDAELREYLEGRGLKNLDKAVRNIRSIESKVFSFQTLRGRRLMSSILPAFIDEALKGPEPDAALNHLQSFAGLLSTQESYLEIFSRDRSMIETMIYVFSQSEYLTKVLISRPRYLEMIGWQEDMKKSVLKIEGEMREAVAAGKTVNDTVRLTKQAEEIRLGMMFMQKKIVVGDVTRGLSRVADAVLSVCLNQIEGDSGSLAVIALGKLGGREINFGSDLDLIFVSAGEVTDRETRIAERFLRMLISYTKEGVAYRVDTRLRPEGSKGPLVSPVSTFRGYYGSSARFWELQALLKARPVSGDSRTGRSFISMARDVLMVQGRTVSAVDILNMRERIMRELSKESMGYDIKLGPGGLEELEFTVQFLQMRYCHRDQRLLVQNTLNAVRRLKSAGIIDQGDAVRFSDAYTSFRTIESLMRLRGDDVVRKGSKELASAALFMGYEAPDTYESSLQGLRMDVMELREKYLRDS